MNPIEFAQKYLGEYKIKGNEIIPKYCPYCHGGNHGDKYTFALNMEKKTFNCKRGTCGEQGTFYKLCKDFGEEADGAFEFKKAKAKKHYKKPKTKLKAPSSKVEAYLKLRGFSPETWQRRGVGEYNGAVALPYYENGELVLMKFRTPEKHSKHWREEGGKDVFWGMDLCTPEKPLIIVEGEMDALALDECGIENVVSVPSGAGNLECVDNCWEWLEQFNRIIIWPDNDEPGHEMARKLIARLGEWRCSIVQCDIKDANEVLYRKGKEAVIELVQNAKEVPMAGIIRLADVKSVDYTKIERVKSSIEGVNKVLGGYFMGEVSVWTGINSSGKSTFLGQELLEAIDQGFNVCAYSGELPATLFKTWIDLQASGPKYVKRIFDPIKGEDVPTVDVNIVKKINHWYYDKFFLFDSFTGGATDKDIFRVFEYAARRYNCKVFLIDNLMTTTFTNGESDFYRAQSIFVGQVINFAKKFNVHVHLVAHPRKNNGGKLTKMDIAGSGDITNRADNVLAVHRITDKEKEEESKYEELDNLVQIFKNRIYGLQDIEVGLKFDWLSKRFYSAKDTPYKEYGWVEKSEQIEGFISIADDEDCPF